MKKKLTDQYVKNLKAPKDERLDVFDISKPGFFLRVTTRGVKSWHIVYRAKNAEGQSKQRRMKLGVYDDKSPDHMSLKDAHDAARTAQDEVTRRNDPREIEAIRAAEAAAEEAALAERTMAVVIERYRASQLSTLKTGADRYRKLKANVLPAIGHRPIDSITRQDIRDILETVKKRGVPMANSVRTALSAVFSWAIEYDLTEVNHAANIKPFKGKSERDRVFSDDELASLWGTFDQMGYPGGDLLKLLTATGTRIGETARMRWEDIDMGKREWLIPAEHTKMKRDHLVPLSSLAMEVLEGLPKFSGPNAFTKDGGVTAIEDQTTIRRHLRERKTVEDARPHDLRRTLTTWMEKTKVPERVFEAVLDHSKKASMGATSHYARHDYAEEKREALEAWGSHVAKIRPLNVSQNIVSICKD